MARRSPPPALPPPPPGAKKNDHAAPPPRRRAAPPPQRSDSVNAANASSRRTLPNDAKNLTSKQQLAARTRDLQRLRGQIKQDKQDIEKKTKKKKKAGAAFGAAPSGRPTSSTPAPKARRGHMNRKESFVKKQYVAAAQEQRGIDRQEEVEADLLAQRNRAEAAEEAARRRREADDRSAVKRAKKEKKEKKARDALREKRENRKKREKQEKKIQKKRRAAEKAVVAEQKMQRAQKKIQKKAQQVRKMSTSEKKNAARQAESVMASKRAEFQDEMNAHKGALEKQRREIAAQEAKLKLAVRSRTKRKKSGVYTRKSATQEAKEKLDQMRDAHAAQNAVMQERHDELEAALKETADELTLLRTGRDEYARAVEGFKARTDAAAREHKVAIQTAVTDSMASARERLDAQIARDAHARAELSEEVLKKNALIASVKEEAAAARAAQEKDLMKLGVALDEERRMGEQREKRVRKAMKEEMEKKLEVADSHAKEIAKQARKSNVVSMLKRAAVKSAANTASQERNRAIKEQEVLHEELRLVQREVKFLRREIVRADIKRGWNRYLFISLYSMTEYFTILNANINYDYCVQCGEQESYGRIDRGANRATNRSRAEKADRASR